MHVVLLAFGMVVTAVVVTTMPPRHCLRRTMPPPHRCRCRFG
ncbi:hypothetical protein [Prauserella sediminis]|nr:hypothetical protein [Prauserella sediminis]